METEPLAGGLLPVYRGAFTKCIAQKEVRIDSAEAKAK